MCHLILEVSSYHALRRRSGRTPNIPARALEFENVHARKDLALIIIMVAVTLIASLEVKSSAGYDLLYCASSWVSSITTIRLQQCAWFTSLVLEESNIRRAAACKCSSICILGKLIVMLSCPNAWQHFEAVEGPPLNATSRTTSWGLVTYKNHLVCGLNVRDVVRNDFIAQPLRSNNNEMRNINSSI